VKPPTSCSRADPHIETLTIAAAASESGGIMIGSQRASSTARVVLAILVALALGDTVAAAQALPQLHSGMRVRIRAPTVVDGQLTGKIASRTAEALVVTDERRGEFTVPFAALSELNVSRGKSHSAGALKGAMWGAGLGLGVGLMFAAVPNSDRHSQSGYGLGPPTAEEGILLGFGGGLVIGFSLGGLAGSERWDGVHVPASIAVVPVGRRLGLRFAINR
jgi:hypothetical protein